MRDYEKELSNQIATLEDELKKMEYIEGINLIYDLVREHGLEKDPRYLEGMNKLMNSNHTNILLKHQLKAQVWQRNDLIEQVRATKLGKFILSKCEIKQTF